MAPIPYKLSIAALAIAIVAATAPFLYYIAAPYLTPLSSHLSLPLPLTLTRILNHAPNTANNITTPPFTCVPHGYTTEIISLSPLLIYIDSFLTPREITALLAAGAPLFAPSAVHKHGRRQGTADRTSSSAALPRDDAAVSCVLARAEAFLGSALLDPVRDDVGPPQLVRYRPGERFNRHRDWYPQPQPAKRGMVGRGKGRSWNRVASFFAILEDGCLGGETWFPLVNVSASVREGEGMGEGKGEGGRVWRQHEDGGVAFKPVAGNALFWVNLFPNGTGDERTVHAGLPVEEGLKTAMNIWPRKFYD
ncbi:hypothetical protein F5B20DRAFT_291763 [Whalleya microplaca]|nr:hypothetical protein F5B20DRAFT_291763 [Whalleya microplaca]